MSIRLEEIQQACSRPLDPTELTGIRSLAFSLEPGGTLVQISRRSLMSLIGSYERSHYEPGPTDYSKKLRELLGEAVDRVREARSMATAHKYRVDEGWLEAVLMLLRQAQRQAI